MCEPGRSLRDVAQVNYTEPGDYPDLSALESSAEVSGDTSIGCTGDSILGDPSFASSPKSTSHAEEEAIVMSAARANQLIAELEAIFFQLEEVADDVNTRLNAMSTNELNNYSVELKDLRVKLVKANQEFNLVSNGKEYDERAKQQLLSSKDVMIRVKHKISSKECVKEEADEAKQKQLLAVEQMKWESKISAFNRSSKEIETMFVSLNKSYTAPCRDLSRDQMLKRHKDVKALSSKFDAFRERIDRLINQTDLVFNDKEKMIDYAVDLLGKLEISKQAYEKKSYEDLVANDLTEDKRKLAESIQIDVGKFNGVLGVGDDFYTFKSKFMKAYSNYPQLLLVQYLKNNHLEGKAKDCVGSLDVMENIWIRLKNNFGNTNEMLMYHFQRLNKLGQMNKQKTYTAKKHYLQTVINTMQDAIDVATEHDLTGEVHYGPQLVKVVALLENYLQTAWYKIVTQEALQKPNRWARMIVFLEANLSIIQTRANETESTDPDAASSDRDSSSRRENNRGNNNNNNNNNRDTDRDSSNNSRDNNTNNRNPRRERVNNVSNRETCNLCGDVHRDANKEFILCKKFLEMRPNQRGDLVRRKHKCLQCLDGTARWNDGEHMQVCPAQWVCPNEAHARFDRKLHFLLCGPHSGEEANLAMFERFKTEVLRAEWQRRVARSMFVRARSYHIGNGAPADEICADFAAQLEEGFGAAPEAPADEICADFASQLDEGFGAAPELPAGEISADFAVQLDRVDIVPASLGIEDARTEVIAEGDRVLYGPEPPAPGIANVNVGTDRIPAMVEMDTIPGDEIPDAKCHGSPVFILQPVPFNNHVFNLMFDSGCETFVCRKGAVDLLPDNCKRNIWPGPIMLNGVGGVEVQAPHGHYEVKLPIHDGRLATFSGLCLDTVTGTIPPYPVREARKSIVDAYIAAGGKEEDLPNVPLLVGGDTDFLFGMAYNWFLPQRLFVLPCGLAIYMSVFVSIDGSRGCIGGNHELFTQCERQFLETGTITEFHGFLRQQIELFNTGFKVCLDYNTLNVRNNVNPLQVAIVNEDEVLPTPKVMLSTRTKLLGCDADAAGTVFDYRCPKCRACSDCKCGERIEEVSLKSEREQSVIDSSVSVDFNNGRTEALLPFMEDPAIKLIPNQDIAMKVYKRQTKKLSKDPVAKEAVLKSEEKLQQAGHVEWVGNLSTNEIKMLDDYASRFYMPWRFVYNENSISTPVRVVFDASAATASGFSINDILAKGINSLNSMLEIWIRFRLVVIAIHTDIKMMYNVVKLRPEHWTYQRYFWDKELDPVRVPQEKIIKTLIYGVKSSGNQAQCGLRVTAKAQQDQYPAAASAIINDTYVDDCVTGANDTDNAEQLMLDIVALLARGGFTVKGFTLAKRPPPPNLTKDGEMVSVFGSKWFPEKDEISIAIGPLNFAKKYRGKRGTCDGNVPEILTKQICLGKVHELYDISGLVAPLMATFKLDLSDLFKAYKRWDEPISDVDREQWIEHFQTLLRIGEIRFSRVVIPENAESLDIELIGTGDASALMTCAACYARFKLKDGQYSCQLILAKTKIVPDGMSLPRAELLAAVLNVYICQVMKRAMKERLVRQVLVTDSEIALYWMNNDTKQLKPWTRNRVIEANRFSEPAERFHVASEKNPADIGTRRGVTIEEVSPGSEWQNGKPWMTLPFDSMRESHLSSVGDIKYRKEQLAEIRKESAPITPDLCTSGFLVVAKPDKPASYKCCIVERKSDPVVKQISKKVTERLKFSKYIIDPNRFNFSKVVHIVALVIKYAKTWLFKSCGKSLQRFTYEIKEDDTVYTNHHILEKINMKHDASVLSDDELQYGLDYFFLKTTEEVKKFANPKHYEKNSFEKNSILYYSSRVDPGKLSFASKMTDAMIDLSSGSFEVPIVDYYSPVAFGIVNQIHWYHPTAKHSGVESTIRFVMNVAHILGVRDLVKAFRRQCTRCRYILKRTIEVPMGPVSKHQLSVAPPYYVTQCDLCGAFKAYSKHNRRTTLKVWIVAFVCATTGMTNLKIMEGYDTTQFLLAFSRFSSEAGFPKLLLVDEGGQLVRGCENMSINMCDVRGVLRSEFGVDFQPCPVGGHNFHGKAERKIKAVQETMVKSIPANTRLSTIEWETLCSSVANTINNLPVAIGNETEDLECIDLITPNRLKLGRNNERSPVGPVDITDKFDRILKQNIDIYNTWWEAWLTSAVPKLVPQPKWFTNDGGIRLGDIVIFKKVESALSGQYQYGIVQGVNYSSDNVIRSVLIRYRNSTESIDRTTTRSVRTITVIHRVDELNIMEELGNAALLGKEIVNLVTFSSMHR